MSQSTAGAEGNGHSTAGKATTSNGGVTAFASYASTLVSGDTNQAGDIFISIR